MKKSFLLLTLGALLACPVLTHAQNSNPPPPPGDGPGGHHMGFLTDDQKAELKKAHDEAIAANPSLATEEQQLHSQMQPGTPPTEDQKAQFRAFREKMDAAMVAADPNVKPILAEIKEHMHHHHGDAGGPPPATTGTGGSGT